MLRKQYRLKSPRLFKRALGGIRLCSTDCFSVFGLVQPPSRDPQTAPPSDGPKFGLIVSKKIDKRATRRNRIKRKLREIIRTRLLGEYQAKIASYRAIVIIARPKSLEASYEEMQEKLIRCFR